MDIFFKESSVPTPENSEIALFMDKTLFYGAFGYVVLERKVCVFT